MDEHKGYLQQVCRVGGRKFSSLGQSTQYSAKKYEDELLKVYKINISSDNPDVHSECICALCEKTLQRARTHAMYGGGGCGPVVDWHPHSRLNCAFCKTHGAAKSRGRPCDTKSKKRPSTSTSSPLTSTSRTPTRGTSNESGMDIKEEHVMANACDVQKAKRELQKERFIDQHIAEIRKLCTNAVDGAIESACCQELFCSTCICTWLARHSKCSSCEAKMLASSLVRPGKVLSRMLSHRAIHCDFHKPALDGCPEIVPIKQLQYHVAVCPFNPDGTSKQDAIRAVRPSSLVSDVCAASPSKLQGDVAGNLTARMVTGRMSGGRLEFKTSEDHRGHSTVLQLTPTAVVPSTDASASTLKRRTSEMIRQAESISGGSDGARVQLIAGLKKLSATAQETLLQEAGLRSSSPAAGTALAIKADLRLPWSQLRKLRQWLKVFGVKIESEHSMRSFIATTLPTYTALEVPMAKKNGEVVMAPMVFFLDLIAVEMNHLDILHESQRLTWHDGVIPENEIWIKIGGDHGGGNFKFSMQVANTASPNATSNTIPVCIFQEKDTAANLETALGRYREQIIQLQKSSWKGKALKVYMLGDYEYQTVNYGLSGSGGVRPCLHCHCTKKDMANTSDLRTAEDQQPRTLTTLTRDHERYIEAGSQLSQAKHYNNVIWPCILPVPISNAITPVLHLDLGIFTWMFEALLKDLNKLDMMLATKCAPTDDDGSLFIKLCALNTDLCRAASAGRCSRSARYDKPAAPIRRTTCTATTSAWCSRCFAIAHGTPATAHSGSSNSPATQSSSHRDSAGNQQGWCQQDVCRTVCGVS